NKIYNKLLNNCDYVSDDINDVDINSVITNKKWEIIELKFDNCLSYGKNNVINFSNYDKNNVIGIFAPNYYGKSAIIDIILFCLFEKMNRGDKRDILNRDEKSMYCSLTFKIGQTKYLIEREGKLTKNELTFKVDVNIYQIDENITKDKNSNTTSEKLKNIN